MLSDKPCAELNTEGFPSMVRAILIGVAAIALREKLELIRAECGIDEIVEQAPTEVQAIHAAHENTIFYFMSWEAASSEEHLSKIAESSGPANYLIFVVINEAILANQLDQRSLEKAFEVLDLNISLALLRRRIMNGLNIVKSLNYGHEDQGELSTNKRPRRTELSGVQEMQGTLTQPLPMVRQFVSQLHEVMSKGKETPSSEERPSQVIVDTPLPPSPIKRKDCNIASQYTPNPIDIHCGLLLEQALLLPTQIPFYANPTDNLVHDPLEAPLELLHLARAFQLDVFNYTHEELLSLCFHAFQDLGLLEHFDIKPKTLKAFLAITEKSYHATNPYHNFRHAVDVTMNVYAFLSFPTVYRYLMKMDTLGLMIAAIAHDVDHRGCNNAFEVNVSSALALRYNDTSVLENHHVSFLFTLFRYEEYNILSGMSQDDYKEIRRMMIKSILATDMVSHYDSLGNFVKRLDSPDTFTTPASKEDRQTIVNAILHFADICNACKPWDVHRKWQDVLMEEFFVQGDKEKSLGLKVSNFCDRTQPEPIKLAVNFMDHFVTPMFSNLARFIPELSKTCAMQLTENRERWIERQISELHASLKDGSTAEKPQTRPERRGRPF